MHIIINKALCRPGFIIEVWEMMPSFEQGGYCDFVLLRRSGFIGSEFDTTLSILGYSGPMTAPQLVTRVKMLTSKVTP